MPNLVNKPLYAGVDFGTNTFHVLIALMNEASPPLSYVANKRWFVFLDRSKDSLITDEAYQRATTVAEEISDYLKGFNLEEIHSVATEVFRNKTNGNQLLREISNKLGSEIRLIDGHEEAELTFIGVNNLIHPDFENYLLVDIGGGSTELINVHANKKFWDKSYKIGLSVLRQHIDFEENLGNSQVDKLSMFLDKQLNDRILQDCEGVKTLVLNGGSAELFHKVLAFRQMNDYTQVFSASDVGEFCEEWMYSPYELRLSNSWIPDQRKQLMPLYLANVKWLIDRFSVEQVVYSAASLKEGLILRKK